MHALPLLLACCVFLGTARGWWIWFWASHPLLRLPCPLLSALQALERLDALAEGARGSDPEAAAFLQAALLRRLQDEEQSVVQAALGTRSLLAIPPTALLDALSSCLLRALCLARAGAGSKADRAAARGTAKKAVKVLSGPFVAAHPQHAQRVAPLLMAALLAGPSTRRLADAALQGARRLDHPLLAGLKDVHAVAAEAPPAPAPAKKTPKQAAAAAATAAEEAAREAAAAAAAGSKADAAAAQNLAVISALAAHVVGSPKAKSELQRMLCSDEGNGRLLQLLVANAAMALPGGEDVAAAMLSSPQQRPYARPQAHAASAAEDLSSEFGAEDNLPSPAALAALVEGGVSEEELEGLVLVTALRAVPAQALQSLGTSVSSEGEGRGFRSLGLGEGFAPIHVQRKHRCILRCQARCTSSLMSAKRAPTRASISPTGFVLCTLCHTRHSMPLRCPVSNTPVWAQQRLRTSPLTTPPSPSFPALAPHTHPINSTPSQVSNGRAATCCAVHVGPHPAVHAALQAARLRRARAAAAPAGGARG